MSGAKAVRQGAYPPRDAEWFVEPLWCVRALRLELALPKTIRIWDPACGCGTIPKEFASNGHPTFGSDKYNRGYGEQLDFLQTTTKSHGANWIITNPPFSLATEFVDKAYALGIPCCALVLRLAFLEGMRRLQWLRHSGLSRVYVLSARASMPPGDLLLRGEIEATGGSTPYAWFVFQRGWFLPPQIDWLVPPIGTPPDAITLEDLGL